MIALFGSGKVGTAIAVLLKLVGKKAVVIDRNLENLRKVERITGFRTIQGDRFDEIVNHSSFKNVRSVVSALPFFETLKVAELARAKNLNYVDLTEDIKTASKIRKLAEGAETFFLPQTGLAPGLISVFAKMVCDGFESIDELKLRVGALPIYPSNSLKYNLTWSTEGLVNEYIQDCEVLEDGVIKKVPPLEGYETFAVDGVLYEAFNTSGGIGTLHETLRGVARKVNYKSIRYPGHRDYMRFLLEELRFKENPRELCKLLERAIPTTGQDMCIIFVQVSGLKHGMLRQETLIRKVYHRQLNGEDFSAIQLVTAAGCIAALEVAERGKKSGFCRIEDLSPREVLQHKALKIIGF